MGEVIILFLTFLQFKKKNIYEVYIWVDLKEGTKSYDGKLLGTENRRNFLEVLKQKVCILIDIKNIFNPNTFSITSIKIHSYRYIKKKC